MYLCNMITRSFSQCTVQALSLHVLQVLCSIRKQEMYFPTCKLHYLHGPLLLERGHAVGARECIPMHWSVPFSDALCLGCIRGRNFERAISLIRGGLGGDESLISPGYTFKGDVLGSCLASGTEIRSSGGTCSIRY